MESFGGMFKIMLLGDTEIDTSSFFPRLFITTNTKLTTGVDLGKKKLVVDEKEYQLQIWDCSVERFKSYLPIYSRGARGALLLYDVTRSHTLGNIGEWANIVRQTSGDIPIMLIGIIPKGKNERQVSAEEGKEIAELRNLDGFIECSISKGENIEKIFEDLVRLILVELLNSKSYFNLKSNGLMPEIKIFVDVSESTTDKVVICQENADKLGIKNGSSIEVHNPDNEKKTTAVIEISNMVLDFAAQVSKNLVDSLDFMGVELILRRISDGED